jgi:hypothetical protein
MTLTLNLDPHLEQQLRQEAARLGVGPDDFVRQTLSERLQQSNSLPPHVSAEESELLERIDLGLSQQQWARYHDLVTKLQDELMTPGERDELISLTDRIEAANVRRLHALIELSGLRGVPLEQLMSELGVSPNSGGGDNA